LSNSPTASANFTERHQQSASAARIGRRLIETMLLTVHGFQAGTAETGTTRLRWAALPPFVLLNQHRT
jgi:hypothetical protein